MSMFREEETISYVVQGSTPLLNPPEPVIVLSGGRRSKGGRFHRCFRSRVARNVGGDMAD